MTSTKIRAANVSWCFSRLSRPQVCYSSMYVVYVVPKDRCEPPLMDIDQDAIDFWRFAGEPDFFCLFRMTCDDLTEFFPTFVLMEFIHLWFAGKNSLFNCFRFPILRFDKIFLSIVQFEICHPSFWREFSTLSFPNFSQKSNGYEIFEMKYFIDFLVNKANHISFVFYKLIITEHIIFLLHLPTEVIL